MLILLELTPHCHLPRNCYKQMYEIWYVEGAPLDAVPSCSAQSAQLSIVTLCLGALSSASFQKCDSSYSSHLENLSKQMPQLTAGDAEICHQRLGLERGWGMGILNKYPRGF